MENQSNMSKMVQFINIQDYGINSGTPSKVAVEFIVNQTVMVSSEDWVAIFPEAYDVWSSPLDLDVMVDFEFVLPRPTDKKTGRYKLLFSLTRAKNLIWGDSYQFVYHNKVSGVLGVSSPFRFLETIPREILKKPKTTVLQETNIESGEKLVECEPFKRNKKERNQWDRQGLIVMQEEISTLRIEKDEEVDSLEQQLRDYGGKNKKNKHGFSKLHQRVLHNSTSERQLLPGCKSLTSYCSNCQRVGNLLKTQTELYSQVKNLAEINSDLQKQVSELQKQVELGQAAYQKLSVSLMHERELTLFFQAAAQDRAYHHYQVICVYQPIFVGLDYFQRPIYAIHPVLQYAPHITHQVTASDTSFGLREICDRNSSVSERQRSEDKVRHNQMLRYKAAIGSQEERIRFLTQRIIELESMLGVKKVKAVVKDIEKLNCGDQLFNNNNDGENVQKK